MWPYLTPASMCFYVFIWYKFPRQNVKMKRYGENNFFTLSLNFNVSQNIPTSAQFHIVQLHIFKVSGSNFQVFSEICPGQDLVGEKR